MKKIVPLLLGLCLLASLFATPVLAQVPPLPHLFYGTVEIKGEPAAVWTTVEVRGEGVETGIEGNPIMITKAGRYGGPAASDPKLMAQGFIEEGTILTFYVNGVEADQTYAFSPGAITQLDLTVPAQLPSVTTQEATNIATTSARLNGNLTSLGTAASVSVSFEWGTSSGVYPNTTTSQAKTATGTFSFDLSSLSSSTTYYFRAKAVGDGTSYGAEKSFTTSAPAAGGGGGGGGGPDTTPPRISNVSLCPAVGVTETTADICWITDEKSTSQVEYWTSPTMLSPLDETYVTEHHVQLTGLTPGTTYHYKTRSKDRAGNLAVSPEYTFTTKGKAPAAAFTSCCLSISPSEVIIGEEVTISVSVNNTGNAAGSYEVTLKINGVVEKTKKVTLDAGASEKVTFTTSKDVAGTYSVAVDGVSGSFTVKEKPAVPPPPPEKKAPPPVKAPINWPLIGGIIAGVVIVGLLIFFLVRRRAY